MSHTSTSVMPTDDQIAVENAAREAARPLVTSALRLYYADAEFRAAVDKAVVTVLTDDRYDAQVYDVRRGATVALYLAREASR